MMSPAVTSLSSLLTLSSTVNNSSFSTFDGTLNITGEWERNHKLGRPSKVYKPRHSYWSKVKNLKSHATVNKLPADWEAGRQGQDGSEHNEVIKSRWLSEDFNIQTVASCAWWACLGNKRTKKKKLSRRTLQDCEVVMLWIVSFFKKGKSRRI